MIGATDDADTKNNNEKQKWVMFHDIFLVKVKWEKQN